MLNSIRNVKLYKIRKFIMFITAVCILFVINLRWPKNKRTIILLILFSKKTLWLNFILYAFSSSIEKRKKKLFRDFHSEYAIRSSYKVVKFWKMAGSLESANESISGEVNLMSVFSAVVFYVLFLLLCAYRSSFMSSWRVLSR